MCCINRLEEEAFWATSWQTQQNGFCAQRRLRSAWASAQSDQSLRCRLMGSLGPNFISGSSESSLGAQIILLGFVKPWINFHIETTS